MSDVQPVDVEVSQRKWEENGNTARCEFTSDEEVITDQDALRKGKIDTRVWYVKRMRIGAHQVSMKLREQTGVDGRGKPIYRHIPVKKSNWKISVDLERIQDNARQEALDILYDRLREVAAKAPPRRTAGPNSRGKGSHLVEIGIYDPHFGMLVWAPEAYEHCDLRSSEEVYANAVADLMDSVGGYRVDRWVFPIGNDLMNFDNLIQTTTGGTFQDCDSRYSKVLAAAEVAVVKAVHEMLRVAPVDVVPVPGNHDYQSVGALARILAAHFRNVPDVRVDTQPRPRKYYRYFKSVIGYSHGNEEKPENLARLMPIEVPADVWAGTTCREFHVGHFHHDRAIKTLDSCEYNGIPVRVNPALAPTNAWHYRRGFVGARRAARAYIYERERAFVGYFEMEARSEIPDSARRGVDVMGVC